MYLISMFKIIALLRRFVARFFCRCFWVEHYAFFLIPVLIFAFAISTLIKRDFGGDFIAYFLPHYRFILSELRTGNGFPLWYPFAYNGLPELYKSELSIFHPVSLLVLGIDLLINKNNSAGITGNIIEFFWFSYLAFGAVGMYLFAKKEFKINELGSIVSALVFALNPLMLPTMNTNVFFGISILPWIFLSLFRFAKEQNYRNFLVLIFFNLLIFASGYPYFYVYFFLAELGYVALFGFKKTLAFLFAYGFAVLLGSFFLLPNIYIYSQSVRDFSQQDNSFELFTSNIPTRMINVLNPMPYGESFSTLDPASIFTSNGVSWGTFVLLFFFIGIYAIVKSDIDRKKSIWIIGLFLLAFIYSFGGYLKSSEFFSIFIPIISKFRSHSISLSLSMFVGCIFIGKGIQETLEGIANKSVETAFWLITILLFLVLSLAPLYCKDACLSSTLPVFLGLSRTVFFLFCALILYRVTLITKVRSFMYIAIFIMLIEYYFYFQHLNGHFLDTTYGKFYQTNSLIPVVDDKAHLYRAYFDNNQFSYNTSGSNVFSYAGYETVPYKGWYKLQDKYGFNKSLEISNVEYMVTTNPNWNTQNTNAVLVKDRGPMERGTETFMSSMTGLPFLTSKSTNTHYIYKISNVKNRFYAPESIFKCDKNCNNLMNLPLTVHLNNLDSNLLKNDLNVKEIKVEEYTPNKVSLKVDATSKAFVLSSENWDSGWNLKINNKPVEIINVEGFRGFFVEAGSSEVVFTYTMPYAFWGKLISLFGFVSVVGSYFVFKKYAQYNK